MSVDAEGTRKFLHENRLSKSPSYSVLALVYSCGPPNIRYPVEGCIVLFYDDFSIKDEMSAYGKDEF